MINCKEKEITKVGMMQTYTFLNTNYRCYELK